MTAARDAHTNNIILGSGEIFVHLRDDAGKLVGGERYVGDTVSAALNVAVERVTIQSGDGPIAEDLVDMVRGVTRTLSITLRDSSLENWRMWLLAASVGDAADPASALSALSTLVDLGAVVKDRYYQLGQTDADPGGYGPVKAGTGHKKGAVAAEEDAVINEDFEFDGAAGRVRSLITSPGLRIGVVAPDTPISRRRVDVDAQARQINAAVRYIEDAAIGKGRDLWAPLCSLAPQGDAALKSRTQEQQFQIVANIIDPGSGVPPLVVTGEDA